MEVNRYLRKDSPDSKGRMTVQIKVSHDGWSLKLSSREKVTADEWDEERQRVRSRAPHAAAKNKALDYITSAIEEEAAEFRRQRRPYTKARCKALLSRLDSEIKSRLSAPPPAKIGELVITEDNLPSIKEFVKHYISDHRAIRSDSSQRKYATVVEHLYAFMPDVDWNDLSLSTINQFIAFMAEEVGLADNTSYGYINRLANMIEYAEIKGVPVNREYKLFPNKYIPAVRHWHPEEELDQIRDATFTSEAVRLTADTYLLACYTGLRVSDLIRFDPAIHTRRVGGVGGYRVIDLTHMVKTRQSAQIALSPYAEDILNQYGTNPWRLLRYHNEQDYNVHIKKVGKEAGLVQKVQEITYRGNVRYETLVPKHEAMTSHTARHTFACNSILRGMDVLTLKDILGHKDIQSTMVYVHIADEFRNRKMLDVWARR